MRFYLGARGGRGEGGGSPTPETPKNTRFFNRALFQAREASVLYVKTRGFRGVRPGRAPNRGPRRALGASVLYVKTRGFAQAGPRGAPKEATENQNKPTDTQKDHKKGPQ